MLGRVRIRSRDGGSSEDRVSHADINEQAPPKGAGTLPDSEDSAMPWPFPLRAKASRAGEFSMKMRPSSTVGVRLANARGTDVTQRSDVSLSIPTSR
jgi:hypothetical protein